MAEITRRGQIHELNWIRGLSALFIVLYHYTTQYQSSIGHLDNWPVMVPWGCGAVNVFFLLTGFFTIYTLKMGSSSIQFVWKRVKRLYPAYWICIVITSVIMALFLPEYLRDIKTIIVNLTMLQNFVGVTNVDGVYWTLSYELIFYFYVAVLLLFKKATLKWVRNLSLVWIAVSFAFYAFEKFGVSNALMTVARLALMPYFAAPFAGGLLLATMSKDQKRDYISYVGVLASIVLSFIVQELSYSVLYFIAVILLVLIVEKRFIVKDAKYLNVIDKTNKYLTPLSFVAGISYPLYLLHQFIGFAIIKHIEGFGLKSEVFIVVPIAIMICLAFVVQKSVDRLMMMGKERT